MRVLVTGAAGMIGRKLTERLVGDGELRGEPIEALELVDVVAAPHPGGICAAIVADLTEPGVAGRLMARTPDVVFHLAGVVSGEAEADFDKGMRVNVDATRALFEAARHAGTRPRIVFTSSIAVFGAPFPDVIPDDFHLTPLTSYGTEKAIGEALLADYTRRRFIDGVGVRLPTITVRPGTPNAAASGFFSGIIREPLDGVPAELPVSPDVVHPHASPRSAVGFLVHAAEIDGAELDTRPNLTMPSISVSVGEQIDALERVAGSSVTELIREVDDPVVAGIVSGWPRRFEAERARALGFTCEASFDDIIEAYLADDAAPPVPPH